MSIVLHGIGLGGGIAIANSYILDQDLEHATLDNIDVDKLDEEVLRFSAALKRTRKELENLRNNISSDAPVELGAILSLNIMMLNDSQVSKNPIEIIKSEQCNAEWAIKLQVDKISKLFDEMEDEYLKERKIDIIQLFERIFKNLDGNMFDWSDLGKSDRGILVSRDLSPADLVNFKESTFSGFVTDFGSLTSHTTIVGRNLDIPAVVGLNNARQLIKDNEIIIVDGINGLVVINPDKIVLREYKQIQKKWQSDRQKLKLIRSDEAITKDGIKIELLANIETPKDIADVKYNNANGIGLFRSEFLFLGHTNDMATEEEQFEEYLSVVKKMKGKIVTIRTADLGADKNPLWHTSNASITNPALGLTGIRLSLAEQNMFHSQLRAILRASHYGNVQVMFPMISSLFELKSAINHLELVKRELIEENIKFDSNIRVGTMIEVPSAALIIKSISDLVDFVSIGTNDLIQYTLAVDRNDESVNYLYDPLHPAVLKLISLVIKTANRVNIPVSICGEMAGDPKLTRVLLAMGLRKFSMYSANILNVKHIVLNTDVSKLDNIIVKILKTENKRKIYALVEELNQL